PFARQHHDQRIGRRNGSRCCNPHRRPRGTSPMRAKFGLYLILAPLTLPTVACMTVSSAASAFPQVGSIRSDSPRFETLVAPDARIEKLGEGFIWSEGPVRVDQGNYLLFSDVPGNKMYRWSEKD